MAGARAGGDARFVRLDPARHRQVLLDLNVEYGTWVYDEIGRHLGVSLADLIGDVRTYADATIDDLFALAPPRGVFYLLQVGDDVAGMGGLRPAGPGAGEIKRMYVRPPHRGNGLGKALLGRLLDDARVFGFDTVRLDTAPFMEAARRTYRAAGFVECEAYEGVELPSDLHASWVFMQRQL